MSLNKLLTCALVVQLVILGTLVLTPAQSHTQPASAQQVSDKYDGDCTGHETQGRCADKCPADTAEGAYFVRGDDRNTGAVVCGFTYFNECPYAAAHSATDDVCVKLKAQYEAEQPAMQDWGGK